MQIRKPMSLLCFVSLFLLWVLTSAFSNFLLSTNCFDPLKAHCPVVRLVISQQEGFWTFSKPFVLQTCWVKFWALFLWMAAVLKAVESRGNAAKAGLKTGDQVIYTSSFFGDELWPADKLSLTKTAINAKPDSVYFVVARYTIKNSLTNSACGSPNYFKLSISCEMPW